MKQKPDFVVLSTNCGAQEDRLVGIVGIGAPLGSHHRQLEKVGETNEKGGDCLCLEKETTKTPCMSKIRVVSPKNKRLVEKGTFFKGGKWRRRMACR